MLVPIAVVAVLFPLGFLVVAWVGHTAMRRLRLEPWKVMLWFGVAEAPVDELARRRAAPVHRSVGGGAAAAQS